MDTKKISQNALFAEAAYADLEGVSTQSQLETALQRIGTDDANNGFSFTQAYGFASHWRVAAHIPNEPTGFSATVFESIDTPGEYTLAIRGTEPFAQWTIDLTLADLADIGGNGIALNQAVDLFNYYQKLITPKNEDAAQYELYEGIIPPSQGTQYQLITEALPIPIIKFRYIRLKEPANGLEIIPYGSLIDVTGHSLGAHLALIMSRLDPERINKTYTYNAPGFDTGIIGSDDTEWFFSAIAQAQTNATGATTVKSFPEDKIYNLVVPEDIISDIGSRPAGVIEHFSEVSNSSKINTYLSAHSIPRISDSLAVYNLLASIGPSNDITSFTPVLEAASNQPEQSLENILKNVADLFSVPITSLETDNREDFYKVLQDVETELFDDREVSTPVLKAKFQNLSIVDVNSLSSSANLDNADGLAYRYALEHLNPFAITGNVELYSTHNTDGELNADQFTDQYLQDRAEFIALKNEIFSTDQGSGSLAGSDRVEYHDRDSELLLNTTLTGPDASHRFIFDGNTNDPLVGGKRADHLYGGIDNDRLSGMAGNDYLEGNKGDDILNGNSGDDTLVGGPGEDHYIYTSGDGADTIIDSDMDGAIEFDGITLSGGTQVSEGVWRSTDEQFTYVLNTDPVLGDTLTINGVLTVKDFTNAGLGINLENKPDSTTPLLAPLSGTVDSDRLYAKDSFNNDTYLIGNAGIDDLFTGSGNDIIEGGDDGDWIYSGAGDDEIHGGSGNDAIFSGEGKDTIFAGDGDDLVLSAENTGALITPIEGTTWNSDPLERDASRAWRYGGAMLNFRVLNGLTGPNDYHHYTFAVQYDYAADAATGQDSDDPTLLYSYSHIDNAQGRLDISDTSGAFTDSYRLELYNRAIFDDSPKFIDGGAGNDLLAGNAGADLLIGDSGDDRLAGNGGNDHLLGNAGKDTLIGGSGDDALEGGLGNDWLIGEDGKDRLYGDDGDDRLLGDDDVLPEALQGDDYLDGGQGNDTLVGYGGKDTLLGGDGNDQAWGGGDADYIIGGNGADILYGDDSNTLKSLHGNDVLTGDDGNDTLYGQGGNDRINGGQDNDQLYGDEGNDTLQGDSGNDQIHGGAGNDRIEGGSGNDELYGDEGTDTFVFHPGNGIDVIKDGDGHDRLFFSGINANRIQSTLTSDTSGNTYLSIQYGQNDVVHIEGGLEASIQSFEFSDGSQWNTVQLLQNTLNQGFEYHLSEAGTALGSRFDDILVGSQGMDSLQGMDGNDTLAGGSGDDHLSGGAGLDEYRFGIGTGKDQIIEAVEEAGTLKLLPGITLDDLAYERLADSLYIHIGDTRDGVVIQDYFTRNQTWRIEDTNGSFTTIQQDNTPGVITYTPSASLEEAQAGFETSIRNYYQGLLKTYGYQQTGNGGYSVEFTSESSWNNTVYHRSYQVQMADTSVETDNIYYQRTLANVDTTLDHEEQVTLTGNLTQLNTTEATYVSAGTSTGNYIDLGNLNSSGVSVSMLEGDYVPVYDQNQTYNPLTGELEQDIKGYWVYPDGAPSESTITKTFTHQYRDYSSTANILTLHGGNSDNEINVGTGNFNIVDGGSGYDVLDARPEYGETVTTYLKGDFIRLPQTNTPYTTQAPGSLLYGNDGDDVLYGSPFEDLLIGGAGHDYLAGGMGNDTYQLLDYAGGDTLFEDGWNISGNGAEDIVVLPEGVGIDDLTVSWGETLQSSLYADQCWWENLESVPENQAYDESWWGRVKSMHTTLDLSWPGSQGLTIVLPHSNQNAGTGIDFVQFQDGTRLTMEMLMERAGPTAGFDPHQGDNNITATGQLYGGDGDDVLQSLGSDSTNTSDFRGDPFGQPLRVEGGTLIGGTGSDTLIGSSGDDLLLGSNVIEDWSLDFKRPISSLWDAGNIYQGGEGHDQIWGTSGADTYIFNLGDGNDIVTDLLHDQAYFYEARADYPLSPEKLNDALPYLDATQEDMTELTSNHDTLRFGNTILPEDITVEQRDDDLVFLHTNSTDSITFENWFRADINQLDQVEFSNGTTWSASDIDTLLRGESLNHAPEITTEIMDQTATEMSFFSYQVPDETFIDPDGDTIALSAGLADGSALPDWLNFDANTRTFSGTPPLDAMHNHEIRITATDSHGLATETGFMLTIEDLNPTISGVTTNNQIVGDIQNNRLRGSSNNDEIIGLSGNDRIRGGWGTDALFGNSGNDLLMGNRGNDFLSGGEGNDRLIGGWGNDTLNGGRGNDLMLGGRGDDTYLIDRNNGQDRIYDTRGNDTLRFGAGIESESVWLSRKNYDLVVSQLGTDDQVTIENWYRRNSKHIERIELSTGEVLRENQVQQLVDAMAGFAPPNSADLDLTPQIAEVVKPVIAAAWQTA